MSPLTGSFELDRRRFLQLMAASAALAGVGACTRMPAEKIFPYVTEPEDTVPGVPTYYATAAYLNGYAKPLLAESHEGRPTKLEGNPGHPSVSGKSDIFSQAELLALYDPDRAKSVINGSNVSTWNEFIAFVLEEKKKWAANKGAGVRFLSGNVTSPTLKDEIAKFLKTYPKAAWHVFEPVNEENILEGAARAFGARLKPLYDFKKAKIVVSLDSDFLGPGPQQLNYSRDFMSWRRVTSEKTNADFNRLYVVEPTMSLTGANADHRRPVKFSDVGEIAGRLAALVGVARINVNSESPAPGMSPQWLRATADDLLAHRGAGVVLAGPQQPPEVHALVFAINEKLGNFGSTVKFLSPSDADARAGLPELVDEMKAGHVDTVFLLGGNPVYDTPSSLDFKNALSKVKMKIRMSLYDDETAANADWFLPESHFLESWGDGLTYDGVVTLQQPLVAPLYETRSKIELFSILNGEAGRSGMQAVKEKWKDKIPKALSDGFIDTAPPQIKTPRAIKLAGGAGGGLAKGGGFEAVFRPDPTIWDGRYANNGWLQELPKPLMQLTWCNAVVLSSEKTNELKIDDGDEVEVTLPPVKDGEPRRVLRGFALGVPGHDPDTITLYLGYGRVRGGQVAPGLGYDAYAVQDHRAPWYAAGVKIRKTGEHKEFATTHSHFKMEDRDLVVHADLEKFRAKPDDVVEEKLKKGNPSLLPHRLPANEAAWAMSIDLTTCIGCNACTIACQAENNIPVVGEEQVRRSREMHWIRVDRYFEGDLANPGTYFQPVPCMQCEKAPCEEVCPTVATNHSKDGLNQMVYNRCVGTRYCSNNCPYKVRRFNFFQYSDMSTRSIQLMYNPDVTVRSRGVMEKCTYCVQRIQRARINAEKENRPLKDGEIVTACAQACPTDAIVFGDKNDPTSRVAKLKALSHDYKLLNDLGTIPRTTYLAAIDNPNPKFEGEG